MFAGGIYRVNERGPELLNIGGKQFLMMGSQSGKVTPAGSGGGGAPIYITRNITATDTVSKTELEAKLRDSNRQLIAGLDLSQRYGRG